MRRRTLRNAVIVVIALILIILCSARIIYVNRQYAVIDSMSPQDGFVEFYGYETTISNVEMWDYDDYYDSISDEFSMTEYFRALDRSSQDAFVMSMDMNITRLREEDNRFEIIAFTLVNRAIFCAPVIDFVNAYNAECNEAYIPTQELECGESTTIHVIYIMYEDGWSKEQWSNRDKLDYELVIGNYPERKGFRITDIVMKDGGEHAPKPAESTEESYTLWEMYGMDEENMYDDSEWVIYDGLEIKLDGMKVITCPEDIEGYNENYCVRDMDFEQSGSYYTFYIEADIQVKNPGGKYEDFCIGTIQPAVVLSDNSFTTSEICYLDERQYYDKKSFLVDIEGNSTESFKLVYELGINKNNYDISEQDLNNIYLAVNMFGHELKFSDKNIKFIEYGGEDLYD